MYACVFTNYDQLYLGDRHLRIPNAYLKNYVLTCGNKSGEAKTKTCVKFGTVYCLIDALSKNHCTLYTIYIKI